MIRFLDLFLSIFSFFFLSPFIIAIAILVKLDSKGPAFFHQKRVGRNFSPFSIYKFRTMVDNAENHGPLLTTSADSRITTFGRLLRNTKIDEVPQIYNVLKGEMSIVGPRPEMWKYVKLYFNEYKELLEVRPGIIDTSSILNSNEEDLLNKNIDPEEYYIRIHLPRKIKLSQQCIKNMSVTYYLKTMSFGVKKIFQNHLI